MSSTGHITRTVQPNQPFFDWVAQLWARRETLYFFVWRDLKVQYESPLLGLLWSVFQPLIYFGIILLVMNFAGREGMVDGLPFQVYLISGLAIWNFVTTSVSGSITSLQSNAGIITKAAFPRFFIVLSPILRSCIDLIIVLIIVLVLGFVNGTSPSLSMLYLLPASILILLLTTIGLAAAATALAVWNRHIRHVVPIILYAGLFALPVFYSASITEYAETLNQLNPMAGSMTLLRFSFSEVNFSFSGAAIWFTVALLIFCVGIQFFRNAERTLADKL